ncbi:hypothetical protein ACP275_02G099700 [Erythranthe tilingii]
MLEKKQRHNSNGECKQWGKWCKRRNFLTKKITTIFSIAGRIRRRKEEEEEITSCSKKAADERKVLEVPFGASNKSCSIQKQLMAGFNFKKWKTIINTKNDINISTNTATKPSIHRWTAKVVRKRDVVGLVEKKKMLMTWRREQGQETNKELELCKKRILMGEKCRPLNRSGALHYDEHGILLPEDLATT